MNPVNKLKEKLVKKYRYRTELHAHTSPASPCSEISPEEMAKTYHEKGYDAVVVANHFIAYLPLFLFSHNLQDIGRVPRPLSNPPSDKR